MKKKILFIFIFILLFSIASVEANEANETDEITMNDDGGIHNIADENNELSDSPKSFADLNETINSSPADEIDLKSNYTYQNDADFIEGIEIRHDVTVNGHGHTINGSGQARAFHIFTSGVTFIDITFIDCGNFSIEYGGAIYGHATLINCTFINNKAHNGGAVSLSDGHAENCIFINNTAEMFGGAFFSGYAKNCTFTNNRVDSYGGAVYNGRVVNCTFTDNGAMYGGAIDSTSAEDCTFTNNHAGFGGGAMYSRSQAKNSIFTNNTSGHGGVMYGGFAENCTFKDNRASIVGGVMEEGEIINSTLINNSAPYGGGIYDGNATNCRFIKNHVEANGGAIDGKSQAINCTFIENHAEDHGGAIDGPGSAVNCTFIKNTADGKGGAFYEGTAETCDFINNTAREGNDVYHTTIIFKVDNMTSNHTGETVFFKGIPKATINITIYQNGNIIGYRQCVSTDGWTVDLDDGVYTAQFNVISTDFTISPFSITVNINKTKVKLLCPSAITMYYDDDVNLTVQLVDENNNSLTGKNISIDIDGTVHRLTTDDEGFVNLALRMVPKFYEVNVSFAEEEWYAKSSATVDLTIKKAITTIDASPFEAYYNEDKYFIINFTNQNDKPIVGETLKVSYPGHLDDLTTDENGQIMISTKDLKAGGGLVIITFYENENYTSSQKTVTMKIYKMVTNITASPVVTYYNEEKLMIITLTDQNSNPISGKTLQIHYNNEMINLITNETGQVNITTKNLKADNYTVEITFEENENITGSSKTTYMLINQAPTNLFAHSVVVSLFEDKYLTITLLDYNNNPLKGKTLSISHNQQIYNLITNETGQVNISTKNLIPNIYTVLANFNGDENYTQSSTVATISINKLETKLNATSITAFYGDAKNLIITLLDQYERPMPGKQMSIDFNGQTNTLTTNETGQISISTKNLTPNIYPVTINFNGDENYTRTSTMVSILINKQATMLNAIPVTAVYGEDKNLIVTLSDQHLNPLSGKEVYITLNSIVQSFTTNQTGQVSINTKNLNADIYQIYARFFGDDDYAASSLTTSLIVKKQETKMTSASVTAVYNIGKDIVITLKDKNGKVLSGLNVKIVLNGKTSIIATNNNGQAILSTKTLIPNTYALSAAFDGTQNYEKSDSACKVIVKKASPKLTAKKKTFKKATKTKKYTITLKDNVKKAIVKVKVTLKIKGKTYKAKTNSKGKATFKIKKLTKKGTYKAKVTFKGNKYYNKISKTAKIKVKG